MTSTTLRRAISLLAALAPVALPAHAQQAACQYVQVGQLPLRYTGPSLDITVDGQINGTPAPMVLNTGSPDTWLTRTGTEKRGLHPGSTGQFARGIGGSSRVYRVRLDDIGVGPAHASHVYARVIGETGFVPSYDASLGAQYLFQTDLEISLADKVLKFFRPHGCDEAWLGYWKDPSIAVPFEYSRDPSPNPHFKVLVNGHELDAVISSGAQSSGIELGAARRAGLKLDGPGVLRLPDIAGVGERHVARWSTTADTVTIGTETIRDATIGVIDTRGELSVDMVLGADFLRAHRVLFAMRQQKLYLAYLGGPVFSQRSGIEPWMQREADGGNADAQFALFALYQSGRGVAQDKAQAAAWLEKADAAGQPQAGLVVGRRLMLQGRYEQGAARIKAALDRLPAERFGALWLYTARLHLGAPELARSELEQTFARSEDDEWPAPIAGFYLGKIDAARLLKDAGDDDKQAHARTCQAVSYMAEWHAARGEQEQAAPLLAQRQHDCPPASRIDSSANNH